MKTTIKIFKKFFAIGLILPLLLFADPANDVLDKIAFAIKTGDAKKLSEFIDSSIEINISDKEVVYSKAQAEQVLKDFFSKHKPKAFKLIHKGESKDNAKYGIGAFTSADTSFRTYIYLKQKAGKYFIQELRFEQE